MDGAERVPRARFLLPLLISVIAALAFNAWVLHPAHFFFADDWGWLERAQFHPWQETVHLFPTALYNDRPVGELLIRGLYDMFWLRHGAWNQVWLALHALNIALFVLLARHWLPPLRLALAGVLAACWFSTLTAVQWIGAAFDLVGATLVLGTLLAYQHAVLGGGRRWPWLLLSVVLHLAAIRTKEFALGMVARSWRACWIASPATASVAASSPPATSPSASRPWSARAGRAWRSRIRSNPRRSAPVARSGSPRASCRAAARMS